MGRISHDDSGRVVSRIAPEASDFYPVAVAARTEPTRTSIHPDRSRSWMRRALPLFFAHKAPFLFALGGTTLAMLIQAAVPRVVMATIDKSLVARTTALWPFIAALVGLGVARWCCNYASRYYMFRTAYNLEYDLRTLVYEHLAWMSFGFYDRVQSGQLISRANSDIRSVQMYLTFAPMIVIQCLSAVVALVIMLTIDVPLALVSMSVMPLVLIVGIQMRKRLFPVSWLVQARSAELATIVDENVGGVRVVKSFAAEWAQLSLLDLAARRVEWATVRDVSIRARLAPLIENLPRLGLALILLYGGIRVIHGQATIGTIVAFNAYVLQLQVPFRLVGALMMMGQRARASAQRIYEVLDESPEPTDEPGAVDLTDCRGEVTFEDVSFSYGDGTLVLDGLDLHVQPGETIALVGRTGAGKSTVTRLIPRFYDVASGRVLIDGKPVRTLRMGSLRHHVGVVLDEPFLFSASIRENIAFGRPTATLDEVVAAARAASADEFIEQLEQGYDTVVGERGYTLSGGQRQRIALARTFLVNPPILILDDATSAIDVNVEQEIHDALRVLMEGRTTIIVAHRLSTIALADRVVLIDGGRVVAQGTHTDLLERVPLYRKVLAQDGDDQPARGAGAVKARDAVNDADLATRFYRRPRGDK